MSSASSDLFFFFFALCLFFLIATRFYLEEPPGVQKLYLDKTPPPIKVSYLSDKEQKDWEKDVQGLTEQ